MLEEVVKFPLALVWLPPNSEPTWQMMWRGLKLEFLSLKHRPSLQYLDMRQECGPSNVSPPALVIGWF